MYLVMGEIVSSLGLHLAKSITTKVTQLIYDYHTIDKINNVLHK